MQHITITAPDDWHCHLRDHAFLARTVADTAARFKRAVIMPNLDPAVTTVDCANNYRDRILAARPKQRDFSPLMTLYLRDNTTPDILNDAKASGLIIGCKLYPQGATTHSAAGVSDIQSLYPLLEHMQSLGLPLLIHGESTHPDHDVFDRERFFIDDTLTPIVNTFPNLKIVLEHITTQHAVEFILASRKGVAATITAHHLLCNRNALFAGGIQPHHYCLPLMKRETDRQALVAAATSGNPKFFLGTDSAPHPREQKESACGCAGIYSAHCAIEAYAMVFDNANALDKLNDFASVFGPQFYGLPMNEDTITLVQSTWQVPDTLSFGDSTVVPFLAGQSITWMLQDE